MNAKRIQFIASLMIAIGGWGMTHIEHGHLEWAQLVTPMHLFGLLAVVGGVLGGRQSARPPKAPKPE
tara:strand:- start:217 stop:417 length:201 start_codon:yes stop_codon:yes gene_type:complete